VNPLLIINLFLIVLAFLAIWQAAATCFDRQYSSSNLLDLNYTAQWGSAKFQGPLAHPVVWVLHLVYGSTIAKWLMATQPASDMIFVVWFLTGIVALAYIVTFLMRLHLVNKSLVYSRQMLLDTREELNRRVPTRGAQHGSQ
jgi:hypothetical protein